MNNPYNNVVNPYQQSDVQYYQQMNPQQVNVQQPDVQQFDVQQQNFQPDLQQQNVVSQYTMPQQNLYDYQNAKYQNLADTSTKTPSIIGSALLGVVGGGTVGYIKYRSPIGKDGCVSEEFAQKAFKDYAKNGPNREYFKQVNKVIDKLNKVDTPDKFKKLLVNNSEICKKNYNGVPFETVYDTVNKNNLNNKVEKLKNTLEASLNHEVSNMKDAIYECWDSDKKKLVKPKNLRNNEIFESISKTNRNIKWQKAGKYGGITAGILASLALIYRIGVNALANKQNK